MNAKERDALIDALIDGHISEADFLRLEAELHVDPAARRAYYERQKLHLLLGIEAEARALDAASLPALVSPWGRMRAVVCRPAFAIAASLIALAAISALAWYAVTVTHRPVAAEPSAAGFGVVAGQMNARWSEPAGLADGALLPEGRIRLASGFARLELFSGVALVVEGDAEFELHSPMEVSVHRGRVRARVPEPAQGFRIRAPGGDVVDLGTEFGIDVSATGSEIHVIDGEVEWHADNAPVRFMTGGQAVRHPAGAGAPEDLGAEPSRFVGIDELSSRLDASRNERRRECLAFRESMSRDPRLIAHFTVDPAAIAGRRLPNQARGASDGAIVAARSAADRFDEAGGALDFSPTGSRVRLDVPGEHASLTLVAWVRINSLDRWFNSLFLTDGHDLGEPHWQILDDGRLFFAVKRSNAARDGEDKHIFHSPPIRGPSVIGRWVMIATVYDLETNEVVHTLNGSVLSREPIPPEYRVDKVKIGAASIGNWGEPAYRRDAEFAVRNLNGALDEFALFGAALTVGELREIYDHGRPW